MVKETTRAPLALVLEQERAQAPVRQVRDHMALGPLAMKAQEAGDLEMGPVLRATVLVLLEMEALTPELQGMAPDLQVLVRLVLIQEPVLLEMVRAPQEMVEAHPGMAPRPQAAILQAILQLHPRLPIVRSQSIHPKVNTEM